MSNRSLPTIGLLALAALVLAGCASPPQGEDPHFTATLPPPMPQAAHPTGAIYQAPTAMLLFEDLKAHRVGDVLTIVLQERTNAEKKADTAIDKGSDSSLGINGTFSDHIIPTTKAGIKADHKFDAQADAKQSNKLEGQVTVTVAQVLPNGNLVVQGEKWITINHGDEYLRIRGIVRPEDIGPDNTVLSTKVANAQILYSGKGTMARSQRPGWLTDFFMSPLMPF
jgi:flagellar L-ring protein precursor FlgH